MDYAVSMIHSIAPQMNVESVMVIATLVNALLERLVDPTTFWIITQLWKTVVHPRCTKKKFVFLSTLHALQIPIVILKTASTVYQMEHVASLIPSIVAQMNAESVMVTVFQEHALLERLVDPTNFLITIHFSKTVRYLNQKSVLLMYPQHHALLIPTVT